MKLLAIFAASALAQDYSYDYPDYEDDRRFSDNPEWLSNSVNPNKGWSNKAPRVRVVELRCRVNQYFEKHFANAPEHTRNNAIKNWTNLALKIEEKFAECGGSPMTEEEINATENLCGWTGWLNKNNVVTGTNHFFNWNAVTVRETILNSSEQGCQKKGMRLVSTFQFHPSSSFSFN